MVQTFPSPRPQVFSGRLVEIQETERRHLARELHDEIGQLLTGLRLMLRSETTLAPDLLRERLGQAQEVVDEILARVRRVSVELLLSLFERFTDHTGIQVNFRHAGISLRLAPRIETAGYRIVQEALTNAARHAGVPEVTVQIRSDGDFLNLQIKDAGFGFLLDDALAAPNSGGLIGMRERASLVGGSIAFESAPGAGTTVAAELPLAIVED
jgi:signal transduction histidine kinase